LKLLKVDVCRSSFGSEFHAARPTWEKDFIRTAIKISAVNEPVSLMRDDHKRHGPWDATVPAYNCPASIYPFAMETAGTLHHMATADIRD